MLLTCRSPERANACRQMNYARRWLQRVTARSAVEVCANVLGANGTHRNLKLSRPYQSASGALDLMAHDRMRDNTLPLHTNFYR